MQNLILLTLGSLIFFGYCIYVFILGKQVPTSISSTYKIVKRSLFTFTMVLFPLLLISVVWNMDISTWSRLWLTAGGLLIMACGLASDTTYVLAMNVHVGGATGGMICSMIGVCGLGWWFVPLPVLMILFTWYALKTEFKNHTTWLEIADAVATILPLFILIIKTL
jgi:hypothetical protein